MILDIIQTSKGLVTADFIIKHGEKEIGSSVTTNKLLKEKYNPKFTENIRE